MNNWSSQDGDLARWVCAIKGMRITQHFLPDREDALELHLGRFPQPFSHAAVRCAPVLGHVRAWRLLQPIEQVHAAHVVEDTRMLLGEAAGRLIRREAPTREIRRTQEERE